MLIDRKAEIGMILLACSFPAWILIMVWVSLLFPQQAGPLNLRDSVWVSVTVLAIAGLLLYIIGRKRFLNRTRKNIVLPALSLSLGLWLSILGLFLSWSAYSMTEYQAGKLAMGGRSYDDIFSSLLIKGSPIYFWLILLTISGIILVIDSWRILSALDQKNTLTKQQ